MRFRTFLNWYKKYANLYGRETAKKDFLLIKDYCLISGTDRKDLLNTSLTFCRCGCYSPATMYNFLFDAASFNCSNSLKEIKLCQVCLCLNKKGHCKCNVCASCNGKTRKRLCPQCNTCKNCCDHVFCLNCDKVKDNKSEVHAYCGCCVDDCCHCDGVRYLRSGLIFHKSKANKKRYNKSNRYIAAEIEVAGVSCDYTYGKQFRNVIKKWSGSIVRDGSLPQGGFEINTAPANGDLFIEQINEICHQLLNLTGPVVNEKCGLHIHVDARDFTYYDLYKLIQVYGLIEYDLFRMIPEHRRNSKYCQPCANVYLDRLKPNLEKYKEVRYNVLTSIYESSGIYPFSQSFDSIKKDKYQRPHHYALNLHSWFYRGTVESRLYPGTMDAQTIVNWGMVWANIADFVTKIDKKDILALKAKPGFEVLCVAAGEQFRDFFNLKIKESEIKVKSRRRYSDAFLDTFLTDDEF